MADNTSGRSGASQARYGNRNAEGNRGGQPPKPEPWDLAKAQHAESHWDIHAGRRVYTPNVNMQPALWVAEPDGSLTTRHGGFRVVVDQGDATTPVRVIDRKGTSRKFSTFPAAVSWAESQERPIRNAASAEASRLAAQARALRAAAPAFR